ncbi:MAG: hypothetical protein WC551_09115 [Patescibacteria group bacterium]
MTRVLLINLEFDCAGVSWNLRNALNRVKGWDASSIIYRTTPMAENSDFKFLYTDCVVKMASEYDILHFNNWIWTHKPGSAFDFFMRNEYEVGHPFEKYVGKKQFVFHFHGGFHQFRPQYWLDECKKVGAKVIKCDPIAPIPGAAWLPNILNLSDIPTSMATQSPIKVAIMGPVSDNRRNNGVIQRSLNYIGAKYQLFNSILYAEAIRQRLEFNVSIDNLTQGFIGMWGWESLAMGQALMARIDPGAAAAYEETFGTPPPILNTPNIDFIGKFIADFQEHPDLLQTQRKMAHEWATTHYTPERMVERYVDFYKA